MTELMDYDEAARRFDPVLGIEVHVELGTKTKMFDAAPNAFGGDPNTYVTPVSLGLPGSLPVVSQPTLYWRGQHPDIRSSDLLRVAGITYRVEGTPARWPKGTVVTLYAATDPKTTGGA